MQKITGKNSTKRSIAWNAARFISSAVWPEQYPPICSKTGKPLPYIALAGRSNVGKSSLLNNLCAARQLVKVSSTPGKTQLLNFFCVDEALFFIDLPGYGYAKCPQAVKKEWGTMINRFLDHSKDLSLLLFLLDIRRMPTEEDFQLIEWASWHKKPLALVFTKMDKLNKSERPIQAKKILEQLPLENLQMENLPYVLHSSHTGEGTVELRKLIETCLQKGPASCPS